MMSPVWARAADPPTAAMSRSIITAAARRCTSPDLTVVNLTASRHKASPPAPVDRSAKPSTDEVDDREVVEIVPGDEHHQRQHRGQPCHRGVVLRARSQGT